jgi:hypothetical protein
MTMKKKYVSVEWEFIFLTPDNVMASSSERVGYNLDNLLSDPNKLDTWDW